MSFQTIVIPKKKVNDWSDPAFKSAYQKAYREANKDKIKEKLLEKKETTPKEKIATPKEKKLTENLSEYNKSYYQKNREKLLRKANENKEIKNEYYTCMCGCDVRINNNAHKKTDKHIKHLQSRELVMMKKEDTRRQEYILNLISMNQSNNIIK